jgi:large subunit ribosomal protein L23
VNIYDVIKAPLVTEKATINTETSNQVCFEVDRRANKIQIKEAVETVFKKKVLSVQTMNVKGKPKRVGRSMGKRADRKKAVVRLYPGETLNFFEGL